MPIEYAVLKQACRDGLKFEANRANWWPALPSIHRYVKDAGENSEEVTSGVIEQMPDVLAVAEQLHVVHSEPLLDHVSMAKFQPSMEGSEMILSVSNNLVYYLKKDTEIEDVYFLLTLLRIVVMLTKRIDLSCLTMLDMLEKKRKYIEPTFEGNFVCTFTFTEMVKDYMPQTFNSLSRLGALDQRYLNLIFVDFFVELLPEHQVLRIMDAYLLEGVKVLYRFGLALIRGYKELIKAEMYETAKEFWLAIKADAISYATTYDIPLLFRTLSIEEKLPNVDPFLVYAASKNKKFVVDSSIYGFAYEADRSGLAKLTRPMPISKSNIDSLRDRASGKYVANSPVKSSKASTPNPSPMSSNNLSLKRSSLQEKRRPNSGSRSPSVSGAGGEAATTLPSPPDVGVEGADASDPEPPSTPTA